MTCRAESSAAARPATSGSSTSSQERTPALAALRAAPIEPSIHSEQGGGAFADLTSGPRHPVHALRGIDNADDLRRGVFRRRFALRGEEAGHAAARRQLRVFMVRPRLAGRHAGRARTEPRHSIIYEHPIDVTPLLKFAFTPHLSVAAGVSISELKPLGPATGSQMANAAVASLEFDRRWKDGSSASTMCRQLRVRAGSRELESDLVYTTIPRRGHVSIRLRTPSRPGDRHGRRHHGRRAALRTVHAGRLEDAARVGQVRHRAGRRRSRHLLVGRVSLHGTRAVPRRRVGVGREHRTSRSASPPASASTAGPAFFVLGFPLEHRQPDAPS